MGRYIDSASRQFSIGARTLDVLTTCTWTVPSGVCRVTFEVWGGGGGGGAHCCCDCYREGTSGAGGGYSSKTVVTLPGCAYVVCAGYGGMVTSVGNCTLHWNCCGQQGGTSYVTGFGLSNFCATGGDGGQNTCYWACGCTNYSGIGYGGDQANGCICGSPGFTGGDTGANMCVFNGAGGAPFTSSNQFAVFDACCRCMLGTPGIYPGGGGTTALSSYSCCCSQAGVGANGLVRINF